LCKNVKRVFSISLKVHLNLNGFFAPGSILLYWQRYCTALEQRSSSKFCGVVQGMELRNFCRGRHV